MQAGGNRMDLIIEDFFKANIECFDAIQTLSFHGILDEEEKATHEHNLLFNIIEAMKNELNH